MIFCFLPHLFKRITWSNLTIVNIASLWPAYLFCFRLFLSSLVNKVVNASNDFKIYWNQNLFHSSKVSFYNYEFTIKIYIIFVRTNIINRLAKILLSMYAPKCHIKANYFKNFFLEIHSLPNIEAQSDYA